MDKTQIILLGVALMLPPIAIIVGVLIWQRLSPDTRQTWPRRFAETRWRPLITGLAVFLLMGSMSYLLNGRGSVLRAAIGAVPMASMFAAFSMFSQLRQRRGTTQRCAACEYDLSGAEQGSPLAKDTHDAKCPECGASWGLSGGVAIGDRLRSRRSLAVAILLTLPMIASLIIPFTAGYDVIEKAIVRIMPTGTLIGQISYKQGFRMIEWAELRTRTLTPDQRETLAQGLLTRDALQLHAWGDEAKWLVAEFAAGRLSPETQRLILKRYVDVGLFPLDPLGTMSIRPTEAQARGMRGCFAGWTIFTVRGPVLGATNLELAPASQAEIEIGQAELATPAPAISGPSSPRTTLDTLIGTVPPGGRLSLWIIAEPRVRAPQPVVWNKGVPVTASDAIVVRFDLKPPTK